MFRFSINTLVAAVAMTLGMTRTGNAQYPRQYPQQYPQEYPQQYPQPKPSYQASERQAFDTLEARQVFPNLGQGFEVIGPADKRYNAFALTLGMRDRWINPEPGSADDPLAGMDRLYGRAGFQRRTDLDLRFEAGVQKAIVYAKVGAEGSVTEITAAALQEADGKWICKPGTMPPIKIGSPWELRGPGYGMPIAVYARSH